MRVRLRQRTLDRELAAGLPPDTPPRLLREAQLSSATERRHVAGLLAAVLDAAEERLADPGSALELDEMAVLAVREALLELIEVLRSSTPVSPQAVARARLLVRDPHSPLVRRSASGHALEAAITEINYYVSS